MVGCALPLGRREARRDERPELVQDHGHRQDDAGHERHAQRDRERVARAEVEELAARGRGEDRDDVARTAMPPTTLNTATAIRTFARRLRSSVRWSTSDITLPSSVAAGAGAGDGDVPGVGGWGMPSGTAPSRRASASVMRFGRARG